MTVSLRWLAPVLLGLGMTVVVAACNETPVDSEPEPRLLQYVGFNHDTLGILMPFAVGVEVHNMAGEPVTGAEVTFSVGAGGGWVSEPLGDPTEAVTLLSDSTGSAGGNRYPGGLSWMLGPEIGSHTLEITTPGADPIVLEREAVAGVVYVGVWDPADPDDEERLAGLPDTMRVHATNPWLIRAARERLDTTTGPLWANYALVRRGSGLDTAYVFDLYPHDVQVNAATYAPLGCWYPPRDEAELTELENSGLNRQFCPGLLRVVEIEEVPQWFLDRLQEDRSYALWYARRR